MLRFRRSCAVAECRAVSVLDDCVRAGQADADTRSDVVVPARGRADAVARRQVGRLRGHRGRTTTRRRTSPISGSSPADGSSAPRRLTSNKGWRERCRLERRQPRLAFAAKRDDDEVAQIYVLDVARGGEAQRVTSAPTAASAPQVEPRRQADRVPGGGVAGRDRRRVEPQGRPGQEERQVEGPHLRDVSDPQFRRWIDESKTQLWVVDVGGDRKSRPLFAASRSWRRCRATPAMR